MTTILFDPARKAIYADSQSSVDNIVASKREKKIVEIDINGVGKCFAGFAGMFDAAPKVFDFISGKSKEKPEINQKDFDFIAVSESGDAYLLHRDFSGVYKTPENEICSLGTGWLISLSVLHATGDPLLAMKTAIELDVYSGGDILCGKFENGKVVIELCQ